MLTSCINLVQARLKAVSLLAVLWTVGIVYHHPLHFSSVNAFKRSISSVDFSQFLPRDAMHKRGICRHPVSVCPSVCLSITFVSCAKTNKDIFEIFGSQAILVFARQTGWRCSDGNPLNGGVEWKGVWKNDDFKPISRSIWETVIHCVPKKLWSRTLAITLSNLNRFQKFLHCCKEKKISNKPCVIIPTTP